jgi:hypothetical protein
MGVPQCMTLVTNEAGEQLVYGDSKGAAIMLLCGSREWPARDLISTEEHQVPPRACVRVGRGRGRGRGRFGAWELGHRVARRRAHVRASVRVVRLHPPTAALAA